MARRPVPENAQTTGRAKSPGKVLVVLLLAGASFALSVVPALTAFSDAYAFDVSTSTPSWPLTGYLLSASVSIPIAGKLGDLYGKGRVLTMVLLIFSVGSVICALGESIGVVIAGRVVQGVAGGVLPLSFGIVRDTFPRERMANGLGLLSAILGIGGGIGLPLGAVFVDHLGVSLVFWLGLLGLPAALAAHRLIPASPVVERARIDWLGAVLLSAALASVLLGVTEANALGWSSAATLALLLGGVALLAFWGWVESVREEPLIDLRVLRGRRVAATNLTALLVGFAMFSGFLLIPSLSQDPGYGPGMSVTGARLILAPAALAQLVVGPLAGAFGTRTGFRTVLATGGASIAGSFVWLALEHSSAWHFVVAGALLGAGTSLALTSMANLIVDAVRQTEVGIATAINTVTLIVGGAFGSAVGTAIITSEIVYDAPYPPEGLYTTAFVVGAVGGLLALSAALLIPTRRASSADPAAVEVPAAAPVRR